MDIGLSGAFWWSNQFQGIVAVLLCAALGWFSWKKYTQGKYNEAVGLLMLGAIVLRLLVISDGYLNEWDERYHALVAKNMIDHPFTPMLYAHPVLPYDFKEWSANHIWVHKQPVPLWSMALAMKIFGVSEMALRLPSLLLTVMGIGITYLIGANLFDRKRGYLAAFLFAINGLIIEMTGGRAATDHIDVFFLFFVELAVLWSVLFARREQVIYNVLAGVAIGLAILCKWLPALIVLPVWLLLVLDAGRLSKRDVVKHFVVLCFTVFVVAYPWQWYIHHAFPQEAAWESKFNMMHITQGLEGHAQPFYFFIDKIRINYGELIYLPLLWFGWMCIKDYRNYKRLAILIWFLVPFLFFSFAATKMQAYLLFTAPALFLMTADFWFVLAAQYHRMRYPWLGKLVLVLLLALPFRYMLERVKPFDNRDKNPAWVTDLKKLKNEPAGKNVVLLNYPRPVEAMFYTGITTYPFIPGRQQLDSLKQQGYILWVNDNGALEAQITADAAIRKIKLNTPL